MGSVRTGVLLGCVVATGLFVAGERSAVAGRGPRVLTMLASSSRSSPVAAITRQVRRANYAFGTCYTRAMGIPGVDPIVVVVRFDIVRVRVGSATHGGVARAAATGWPGRSVRSSKTLLRASKQIADCVRRTAQTIQFPASAARTHVHYRIDFNNQPAYGPGGYGFGRSGNSPGTGSGFGTWKDARRYGAIVPDPTVRSCAHHVRAKVPVAVLRMGPMKSSGSLARTTIRRYVRRRHRHLTNCYDRELLTKPRLRGTVSTGFTITKTGHVKGARAHGVSVSVSQCVRQVLGRMMFPKPPSGDAVTVRLQLRYSNR